LAHGFTPGNPDYRDIGSGDYRVLAHAVIMLSACR
jgi:hypothetical protein